MHGMDGRGPAIYEEVNLDRNSSLQSHWEIKLHWFYGAFKRNQEKHTVVSKADEERREFQD